MTQCCDSLCAAPSCHLQDGAVDEEAEEEDEVKGRVVALVLDAEDARGIERFPHVRLVVPRDEAELEHVLHQHHRLHNLFEVLCQPI